MKTSKGKTWYRQDKQLRTAGDLVSGGGTAGAFMTLLYVIIGIGVWGLIGYGVGHVLGVPWLLWLGVLVGAFGGIYLVFFHLGRSDRS